MAPVHTIPEVIEDEHLAARGSFMQAEDAEHGRFRQVAPILAGAQREQPLHRVRPWENTDADALLRGIEMSPEQIEKLRADGAVE